MASQSRVWVRPLPANWTVPCGGTLNLNDDTRTRPEVNRERAPLLSCKTRSIGGQDEVRVHESESGNPLLTRAAPVRKLRKVGDDLAPSVSHWS